MSYKMETFEERKVRYIEKIKNLTMMSDSLARNVLKDKECCEYILRIIMNDSMLTVLDNQVQVDYKNLHGRSAVLDCVAKSGDGRLFNVEIQQEDEGAIPKRARYHLGLMDMNVLNPGEFFDKLPETYIIFVTQDDTLGYKLPIAHVDRIIKENGAEFGDEAHIIYVDSSKHEDTALGRLMHDFHCKAASDMQDGVLAKRIYELKESEEGVTHMCKVCSRRLVTSLSIQAAEARTSEPTNGKLATRSIPCKEPSSPSVPWTIGKMTSTVGNG